MKYSKGRRSNQNDPETRAMIAFRFRTMYRNLGLNRAEAAKLLHVSGRTLQNWETGHHEIPYSAYKLLRLLNYQELAGAAWAGWHMHSGKLWTPEGFGFTPDCQGWWSLLVRQARMFRDLVERENVLQKAMHTTVNGPGRMTQTGPVPQAQRGPGPVASDAPTGAAGRAAKPSGLDLSSKHFNTTVDSGAATCTQSLQNGSGANHD